MNLFCPHLNSYENVTCLTSVQQNGALGNTSSIEEAEYELIELETGNGVSLFIS